MFDRQGRAAPGVAVGLGQHGAGQRQGLVEGGGGLDRVLPLHAVHHEQGLDRQEPGVHGLDLGHHVGIHMQAPGAVHDQHLDQLPPGLLQGVRGYRLGALIGPALQPDQIILQGQQRELLNRGRAMDIATDQRDLFIFLFLEPEAELDRAGGLARALQTGQQDHGGRFCIQPERRVVLPHQLDEFLLDDLDQRLAGCQAEPDFARQRAQAHMFDEIPRHGQGHIGLQQGPAHLTQAGLDIVIGQAALAAQILDQAAELVGKGIKHSAVDGSRWWPRADYSSAFCPLKTNELAGFCPKPFSAGG